MMGIPKNGKIPKISKNEKMPEISKNPINAGNFQKFNILANLWYWGGFQYPINLDKFK